MCGIPLVQAIRDDRGCVHDVETDGTLLPVLAVQIGEHTFGEYLAVARRVVALAELLDKSVHVDRALTRRPDPLVIIGQHEVRMEDGATQPAATCLNLVVPSAYHVTYRISIAKICV